MNQKSICGFFIKRSLFYAGIAVAVYFVVCTVLANLLATDNGQGFSSGMGVLLVIIASTNKDEGINRFGVFYSSRKLMMRVQIVSDVVLAAVVGLCFMAASCIYQISPQSMSFLSYIDSKIYLETGIIYFLMILVLEATLTLDNVRRDPWLRGMFNGEKTTHPVLGFIAYLAIVIAVSIGYSFVYEDLEFQGRLIAYGIAMVVIITVYYIASRISTKKEF